MACLLIYGFFVFSSLQHIGEATRFLPMIVWDHLNPLLKCKRNWLIIPNIDVFDQVDFVCPTLKLNVALLDGYSRPITEMNANIFRRKVKNVKNMDHLQELLNNGSFCDPNHGDSEKLHTCKNGIEGRSLTVVFKKQNVQTISYEKNDTVVFFSNGDGKQSTLASTEKKCTMVFVIKITWGKKVLHDMSYGKRLNSRSERCCNNISIPHISVPIPPPCEPNSTSVSQLSPTPCEPKSTSVSQLSPTPPSCEPKSTPVSQLSPTPTTVTKQHEQSCSNYFTEKLISLHCPSQTCNTVPTSNNVLPTATMNFSVMQNNTAISSSLVKDNSSFSLSCSKTILTCERDLGPNYSGRASKNTDKFGSGIAVGILIGVIVGCTVSLLLYLFFVKYEDDDRQLCDRKRNLARKRTLSLDVKTSTGNLSESPQELGIDNQSYSPVTPFAPTAELEPTSSNVNVTTDDKPPITTDIVGHQNRLSSVETTTRSTNFLPSRVGSPLNTAIQEKEPTGYSALAVHDVKSPRPRTSHSSKKHRRKASGKHSPKVDTVDSGPSDGIRASSSLDNRQSSI